MGIRGDSLGFLFQDNAGNILELGDLWVLRRVAGECCTHVQHRGLTFLKTKLPVRGISELVSAQLWGFLR